VPSGQAVNLGPEDASAKPTTPEQAAVVIKTEEQIIEEEIAAEKAVEASQSLDISPLDSSESA